MPSSIAREMSVVYDSTTIGGSSTTYKLTGWVTWDIGPDHATVDCTAIVVSTARTVAEFNTLVDAFVLALRTPRKRLSIIQSSTYIHDFDPAGSTNATFGFNQMPTIKAEGTPGYDGGFSQLVSCHWEIDLPADTYAQSGRRTSNVSISYDASRRRTVIITGEYRALVGTSYSGLAVYEAAATSYCNTQLGLIGGTYDLIDEEPTKDDTDKIVGFTRTYHEVIYDESDSATQVSGIKDAKLSVTIELSFPGDSPGANVDRMQRASVSYFANIDQDTYDPGTDLVSLYEGTIRPRIVTSVRNQSGAAAAIITRQAPTYGLDGNTISVQMELTLFGGGQVLAFLETCEVVESPHHMLQKAWKTRYSRYVYPIPVDRVRTTTRSWTRVGYVAEGDLAIVSSRPTGGLSGLAGAKLGNAEASIYLAPRPVVPTAGETGQWVPQPERCTLAPRRLGPSDGSQIVTDITWILVEEWAEPITASVLAQGKTLVI